MPLQIIRPDDLPEEKRERLRSWIEQHWKRAETSRRTQDNDFADWSQNYDAIPLEKERNIPWPKASNFVVPVIRMYVETLQAAILNTIFATKPLFKVKGFPKELQESLEIYLECKALYEWQWYKLAKSKLNRGTKYGTAITKTIQYERSVLHVTGDGASRDEQEIPLYNGPKSRLVSFEDYYPYPITANSIEEMTAQFERQRFPKEEAERMRAKGVWDLTEEELEKALQRPDSEKRTRQQAEAGVTDTDYEELELVECHLEWDLNEDDRWYPLVTLYEPQSAKLADLMYDPYPPHIDTYQDYRPIEKDDFFFGDSFCRVLAQAQEEVSAIHNDRRNSSFLASAPIVLRKGGARIPHAGQPLSPARVYTVDEMDDFKVQELGRNHASDMIPEEIHVLTLGQQLIGLNPPKTGSAQGSSDSKGVYNAAGTLAMLAEGNTRQDTNVRDFRWALGGLAKNQYAIQAAFNPNDPVLNYLPKDVAEGVREAMRMSDAGRLRQAAFEVQISDTAHNREVERAQLLQANAIVSQYGQQVIALSQQYQAMGEPITKAMIGDTITMMRPMAKSLLRVFDQLEAADSLPDFERKMNELQQQQQAQQQPGPNGAAAAVPGGGPGPGALPGRSTLEALAGRG